jgi:hypothetical protein
LPGRDSVRRCISIHQNEDGHFVILEGSLSARVSLPETDVRVLGVFMPGGLEHFFLEAQGGSANEIEALTASHGMVIVGPPIRG